MNTGSSQKDARRHQVLLLFVGGMEKPPYEFIQYAYWHYY